MINVLIGVLYVILVIACLFLGLLILVQLPKKDAGAGMAFGGGAGEALFGAGSGNALTKLTKYTAATFIILSLFLSVIVSSNAEKRSSSIEKGLSEESGSSGSNIPAETGSGQTSLPSENAPVTIPNAESETGAGATTESESSTNGIIQLPQTTVSGETESNAASNAPPLKLDLQTDLTKEKPVPDSGGEPVEDPSDNP